MKWVFVGLGQMGLPMARNLASAVDLLAYDREGRDLSGLKVVSSREEVSGAAVLVTCLPDGDVVEDVLFGPQGFAPLLAEGAAVVDTSTTSHGAALRIGKRLSVLGLSFLDAPISGMRTRAEDGTLTMMVGGDEALLDELRPALSSVASNVHHMGPVGSGQLSKLVNQLLFDINTAGLAEILPIAAKLGLAPDRVVDIVNSGTGRSYASECFGPNILRGIFDQGYPLRAAYKDLVAGAELTAGNAFPAPVLAAATATYQIALAEGHGDDDKGAMIKVYEKLLGVSFRAVVEGRDLGAGRGEG